MKQGPFARVVGAQATLRFSSDAVGGRPDRRDQKHVDARVSIATVPHHTAETEMKPDSKRSRRPARSGWQQLGIALALSATTFGAQAAGLGRLNLMSALGQPLRAEIELTSVAADDAGTLTARLAPPAAFSQAGIEYGSSLAGLRFSIQRRPGGQQYVLVTSNQQLNEPFLDLLVELTWASGRLVREYTVLLDPPETRAAAATSSEPATAVVPATSAAAPTIVRRTPRAAPTPSPSVASGETSAAPTRRAAAPTASSAGDYVVQTGDTALSIARANKPDGASLEQMLAALYRDNPQAFSGNVNRLMAGATLKMPDAPTAQAIDGSEARRIVAQSSNFGSYRERLAAERGRGADDARAGSTGIRTAVDAGPGPGRACRQHRSAAAVAPGRDASDVAGQRVGQRRHPAGARRTDPRRPRREGSRAAGDAHATRAAREERLRSAGTAEAQEPDARGPAEGRDDEGSRHAGDGCRAAAVRRDAGRTDRIDDDARGDAAHARRPRPRRRPPAGRGGRAAGAGRSADPGPRAGEGRAEARQAATPRGRAELLRLADGQHAAAGRPGRARRCCSSATRSSRCVGGRIARLRGQHLRRQQRAARELGLRDDRRPVGRHGQQRLPLELRPGRRQRCPSTTRSTRSPRPTSTSPTAATRRPRRSSRKRCAPTRSRHAVRLKLLEIYAKRGDAKTFETMASELYAATGGQGEEWRQAAALGPTIDPHNPLYAETRGGRRRGRRRAPVAPVPAFTASEFGAAAARISRVSEIGMRSPTPDPSSPLTTDIDFAAQHGADRPAAAAASTRRPLRRRWTSTSTSATPTSHPAPRQRPPRRRRPAPADGPLDFDVERDHGSRWSIRSPRRRSATSIRPRAPRSTCRRSVRAPIRAAEAPPEATKRRSRSDGFTASDIFGSSIIADTQPMYRRRAAARAVRRRPPARATSATNRRQPPVRQDRAARRRSRTINLDLDHERLPRRDPDRHQRRRRTSGRRWRRSSTSRSPTATSATRTARASCSRKSSATATRPRRTARGN